MYVENETMLPVSQVSSFYYNNPRLEGSDSKYFIGLLLILNVHIDIN